MKPLPTFTFLLLAIFGRAQTVPSEIVVLNFNVGYRPANIDIIKDGKEFETFEVRESLGIKGLEQGCYKFILSGRGQPRSLTDSVVVQAGQKLKLNINLEGPCLYDHPADYIPICPEHHTDNVIPIVYGLIAKRRDSSDSTYFEGGCIVTDCDPKYYCKVHSIRF